jgi:hypothetical protein
MRNSEKREGERVRRWGKVSAAAKSGPFDILRSLDLVYIVIRCYLYPEPLNLKPITFCL